MRAATRKIRHHLKRGKLPPDGTWRHVHRMAERKAKRRKLSEMLEEARKSAADQVGAGVLIESEGPNRKQRRAKAAIFRRSVRRKRCGTPSPLS